MGSATRFSLAVLVVVASVAAVSASADTVTYVLPAPGVI